MSDDLPRPRKGRIVPVVAVYMAGSWLGLQVVATLNDLIGLPQWIGPAAVALLLIGLVVVTATAWIQSSPVTDAREAAGVVPQDWEIAPRDLLHSLRSGRMPHLNWGRAIGGGVIALSLLVGVAGAYVLLEDHERRSLLESEAGLGVAVLPFEASGAGVDDALGEGLMDLIAANIDAITGLRAISPRAVVVRVNEQDGERQALALARELRAAYVVTGRVTGVGSRLRVLVDVHDSRNGRRIGAPLHADGATDELLQLADQLSVQVASAMLQTDPEFAQGFRPSLSLTASPAALRAFLEGEYEFRRMELTRAVGAYRAAAQEDSTFALAWARIATLLGWVSPGSAEIGAALEQALHDRQRLPERDRLFIEGMQAVARVEPDGLERLRTAVRRYPDDALLWNVLGEYHVHNGQHLLTTLREGYDAFLNAVRLEPAFLPHYIHAIELSVMHDDTATSRALVAAPGIRLDTEEVRGLLISHSLAFNSGDLRYSARAALDTIHDAGTSIEIPLSLPRLLELKEHYTQLRREKQPHFRNARIRITTLAVRGRLAAGVSHLDDPLLTPRDRMLQALLLHSLGAPAPAAGWDRYLSLAHADTTLSTYVVLAAAYATERGDRHEHDRAIALMQGMERVRAERNDTVALNVIRKRRIAAQAHAALRQERLEDARQLLDGIHPVAEDLLSGMVRWWNGELALAQGRDTEALRFYESLRMWDSDMNEYPLRHLRIAQIHERAGRSEQARAALEEFLLMWQDADETSGALQQARSALDELTKS